MKLLDMFKKQIAQMGPLKRVWLTTFNLDIAFVESRILPAVLDMDPPTGRMDYEGLQRALSDSGIDFRIYCDPRMIDIVKPKRTSIGIYPVSVRKLAVDEALYLDGERSLFHPKVFYLEDNSKKIVLGAGSANLTLSGWGRNQEAVDFRTVSSNAQYQQIKQFFMGLLDEELSYGDFFPVRRKFYGDDPDWSFIHSLNQHTLLDALAAGGELTKLSVWSPYLADSLPVLISKLAGPELRVELVPDLAAGQFIRTRWGEELQTLIASQRLTLFRPPAERDPRIMMTHAKLWLAESSAGRHLAIGSWNFTGPGCSSLPVKGRNVEAGIVHPVSKGTKLCSAPWAVSEGDFACEELLEEEALVPGSLPPFDLTVVFDWQRCEYRLSGEWFLGKPQEGHLLILPGVKKPVRLSWNVADGVLKSPLKINVEQSAALLDSPFYTLRKAGEADWTGTIVETGAEYRRALRFKSLDDILDSYMNASEPEQSDNLMLRSAAGQDELLSESLEEVASASPESTSYFRLFQAMRLRGNGLSTIKESKQLHRRLFSDPGCLLELAEMVRARLEQQPGSVFGWFLAQEVNSMADRAKVRFDQIKRSNTADAADITVHQWRSLYVAPPPLKGKKGTHRYLNIIRKECSYDH